ncbi:MAG: hypothetical protein MJ114_07640 [Acetatifactor sp.]|nr:hypothetical protein [Acetatifactor sp.]
MAGEMILHFLNRAMLQIGRMSFAASVMILFVLIARVLLRRAPRIFSYALWAVILFRLLCPISISSRMSVMNLIPEQKQEIIESRIDQTMLPDAGQPMQNQQMLPGVPPIVESKPLTENAPVNTEPVVKEISGQLWTITELLTILWVMGAMLLAGTDLVKLLGIRRRVACSIKYRENIYLADELKTPFCMGLIRPRIYLPSEIGEAEREPIILHEQHHIRRGDHVIKAVAFAALCLHWFNPFVWVAFILAGKDMEMSCDEAVIGRMSVEKRSAYAEALLKLATGRRTLQLSTIPFGGGDPKERIRNIVNYKKPSFWGICIALLLCIVVAISLGTNAAKQKEEREPAPYEVVEESSQSVESETIKEPAESTEEESGEAPAEPDSKERRIYYSDVDGDSTVEYAVFSGEDEMYNIFDFYFNGELVYHHEDLLPVDIYGDRIAYLDLDGDGEKELFLAILPHVNSMPLMEYAVIKKVEDQWKPLEVYQGETMLDNTFPIHVVKEKGKYTAAVYCEGLENHTIFFSVEPIYNYWKEYAEEEEGSSLGWSTRYYFEQEVFKQGIGGEVAHTSAWGVWEAYADTFEGKPCLVAEQGIEGYSKYDSWGTVKIYFDYNEQGRIRLLHLEFTPHNYDQERASRAYSKFLDGDLSTVASDGRFVASEWLIAREQYPLTYWDMDGDGIFEMLVQDRDTPQSFGAIFHYDGEKIVCWEFDAMEGNYYFYPLADGTFVAVYEFGGTRSHTVYRYNAKGERVEIDRFSYHYDNENPAQNQAVPSYSHNGLEITEAAYQQLLKELNDLKF